LTDHLHVDAIGVCRDTGWEIKHVTVDNVWMGDPSVLAGI
jgi:hypothetical protein